MTWDPIPIFGVFRTEGLSEFFTMYKGEKFQNPGSKSAFGPGFACDFCRIVVLRIANAVSHWYKTCRPLDSLVQNGASRQKWPTGSEKNRKNFRFFFVTVDCGGFRFFCRSVIEKNRKNFDFFRTQGRKARCGLRPLLVHRLFVCATFFQKVAHEQEHF